MNDCSAASTGHSEEVTMETGISSLPPLPDPLTIYCSKASGSIHAHCMGNDNGRKDDLNFECRSKHLAGKKNVFV